MIYICVCVCVCVGVFMAWGLHTCDVVNDDGDGRVTDVRWDKRPETSENNNNNNHHHHHKNCRHRELGGLGLGFRVYG